MQTSKNVKNIPRQRSYLKIDTGNEFLYIWDIDDKSYLEVTDSKTGKSILFR